MITPFKVLTVLGTRPEMIRLSKLIQLLDTDPRFIHKYVHTGQNDHPQLRDVFFADLGLRQPDYLFQARQSTRSKTINQMKKDIASVIRKEKPQAFLVLGDTDSALTSEVAKQFNISIFHMEAGNRCFDSRSPEEKNRKFIDAIANYNLPYSIYGEENLKNEKLYFKKQNNNFSNIILIIFIIEEIPTTPSLAEGGGISTRNLQHCLLLLCYSLYY
jgi:UDP-N-acetylglucosamine 2-epimerase (non-hydrolysing)